MKISHSAGVITPLRIIFCITALIQCVSSYRLNVPRVLLPYHPSIPVKFVLEVSQPSGGCFKWRSTRQDVVSVSPLDAKAGECSDKAEIRAIPRTISGELSAVIFAEDSSSGTMLSCGVTVDQIAKIRIKTTTKILFVDAAPARILLEALNSEGDTFSTLSEIPVEWELTHSGEGRPLRIVPFEQSTYEAPAEIVALEKKKKKGYIILVEGVLTGSAMLTARFAESHFKSIAPHSLDLVVVANLLLLPAHDLFLPVNAVVHFQVQIVKQSSTELVPMPSSAYYLKVDSEDICSLDKMTSTIRALARGRTDIHLYSQNVDVKTKTGVRPPSTSINVIDPETIQWAISKGGNWLLQTGTRYKLFLLLLDPHGNYMYISDNLRFDNVISSDYFDIRFTSRNHTYFEVTPKKVGKTLLKSKFAAVLDESGKEQRTTGKVTGEQSVQIVDPVKITPSEVVFPYLPRRKTSFSLKVTGGSGLYDWNVADSTVCNVDSNGVLSSSSLGTTVVTASDKRNPAHKDAVRVSVVDVLSLSFGETRREAEVGSNLVLNVLLMGAGREGSVLLTDCRAADFRVQSSDNSIFKPVTDAPSALPTIGSGCSTVTLKALSSGDAKITVSFARYDATIDVSAYPALKVVIDDVALAPGSSTNIRFEGGPRPWILDSSSHYSKASTDKLVTANILDEILNVKCGKDDGISTLKLEIGNKPSSTLPFPAVSKSEIAVCCATPGRLLLSAVDSVHPKCPSNMRVLLTGGSLKLALAAHGSCENSGDKALDAINGYTIIWTTSNKTVATVQELVKEDQPSAVVNGLGTAGLTMIAAELSGKGRYRNHLKASAEVRFVESVAADPPRLVLWNEVVAVGTVKLLHGSGHFRVHELPGAPFVASVKDNSVSVTPKSQGGGSLRIEDVCVNGDPLDIPVKITDIHSLVIYGPQFMEVGSETEVSVDAVDETGSSFSRDHGALSNAVIECNDPAIHISKVTGSKYRIRALSMGAVSLTATSKSTSGRILNSRPHTIQVFSSFTLHPQKITLIPESTFQLEVIGGPQPTPQISFTLNNSKIATVEPNALITSRKLGCTTITGTINVGGEHSSQNTVSLRVVSLAGVRATASSYLTEKGARIWIRVNGLDESETPFAFGGALYPFKVTWTVSHPGVLQMIHPFGSSVEETDENRFVVWLEGSGAGSATVKVCVEMSANAKQHFVGSKTVFEDMVEIRVEEPLMMRQPNLPVPIIRLAQNTEMQLETAWPQSVVEYSVSPEFARRLSVTKSGRIRARSIVGPAAVTIHRTDLPENETSIVPITIAGVNALDVMLMTKLESAISKTLTHLPVGAKVILKVLFRDSKGRKVTASSKISYRPHRFDLTEIVTSDFNRTLAITLKSKGETVLKIWDTVDPTQNIFIRLSAAEMLHSLVHRPIVSDIVCFTTPLAGIPRWQSSNSQVEWLDVERGIGKLVQAGSTHVAVEVAEQRLTASFFINPAQRLNFAKNCPGYVTNAAGSSFIFPVNVEANETVASPTDMKGCTEEQLAAINSVRAPFNCIASFSNNKLGPAVNILSTKAVFSPKLGSYACVIESQEAGQIRVDVTGASQMDLNLVAKWSGDPQVREAATTAVFHMAMHVVEDEVQLSDVDQKSTVLSIFVPSYQYRHVSATGCAGDVITVTETRQPSGMNSAANKFFSIKLNVKSAALWSDLSEKCSVKVENTITGQTVYVPVRVRIVGQAAKQVYNALDSTGFIDFLLIFLQHYSWIIPSMMWICLLGILSIIAYWFIRRRVWEKEGTFNDTSALRSPSASSLSHASMSRQSSPSFFRDSPIFKSTPIYGESSVTSPRQQRPMGAKGEPTLWSTDASRRK